jgi:hypothetical protein
MDTSANLNKKNGTGHINPDDFTNATPVAKVGFYYPDLYTQACHLNRDIERINSEIYDGLEKLVQWKRYGAIERMLDAIQNYIEQEAENSKDWDMITPENIKDIASEVFAYNVIAKNLLNLLNLMSRLDGLKREVEFTKHHVLL